MRSKLNNLAIQVTVGTAKNWFVAFPATGDDEGILNCKINDSLQNN